MFENPRRGRQVRNFTTDVPKILVLKSSSEQIFSRKLPLGAPVKVRIFGTRKWPFQKQFLAPTVVQRMQFCQYIFQIISENHIFLRVLPNYHQTGTKTLMDQKKTD